ncbi:MAG: hypothetical protein JWP12_3113 [Bacteroidetes bacterium]|nr:hypothetical protein [Bacteroidota bacterium]
MEEKEDYFNETYELLKKYSDDRLLLLKIQTAQKTGKLISKLVLISVSALLLFFLLFFVSIMLGYFFAAVTGSLFIGFSIVAGIYLLLFILFILLFKNFISKKIMDMIAVIFFENNNAGEDDDEE